MDDYTYNEETYQRLMEQIDITREQVRLLQQHNTQLEKENQNFLDTFQAIYTKLGLTEDNTNGKELVSDTVKRRIDEIVKECAEA